jgi:natural product precursor
MKKINFSNALQLDKKEMKKIVGGSYPVSCNCYDSSTGPQTGTDKNCDSGDTISQCCGSGYDRMNCG